MRFAPAVVADAFCATRLAAFGGGVIGLAPATLDAGPILDRAWPG